MPDNLASAAFDLSVLPRADRHAILAALSVEERHRVEAAMRGDPAPSPAVERFHSAWFDHLLHSGDVTPAARAALTGGLPAEPPADPARIPGRTLMQAAGGLLAQARLRR